MKKLLLVALAMGAAFGAQAGLNESGKIPGADYVFPQGLESYTAGTKVQHNDRLFECRQFPNSGFCGQWTPNNTQYEPGVGFAWEKAWVDITPVPQNGVDYHYNFPENVQFYDAGTLVEKDGQVYRCRVFPNSGFCSQWSPSADQYEPENGFAWQEAWEKVGPAGKKKQDFFAPRSGK